jgi:hypothetical protein
MTGIENFMPMMLSQIGVTVVGFLALGIGVVVSDRLKRIRRRYGYLKLAPRYALAYLGKRLQSV